MNTSIYLQLVTTRSVKVLKAIFLAIVLSRCGGAATQSGIGAEDNTRIKQGLEIISTSPGSYAAATKYLYKVTPDLQIHGHKAYGICWVDRRLLEFDADFAASADMKTLVSAMLHEVGHCELGHRTYTAANENAAVSWQAIAMGEVYPNG